MQIHDVPFYADANYLSLEDQNKLLLSWWILILATSTLLTVIL